jgi:hypothetical protein
LHNIHLLVQDGDNGGATDDDPEDVVMLARVNANPVGQSLE